MKVRRSWIKRQVEIVAVGFEHAPKIQNLKIKDGLLSAFDFGERAAADVQTCKLKLSRKPFLRPPAFVVQFANLRSYDIAVPHRARATQAPIAKGQLALSCFVSKLPQLVTKQPFSAFRHRIILCGSNGQRRPRDARSTEGRLLPRLQCEECVYCPTRGTGERTQAVVWLGTLSRRALSGKW
jgi:hypothetical protein